MSRSCADLPFRKALPWAAAAVLCFHLAYEFDGLRGLMVGFLFCLVPLTRLNSKRKAVYTGVVLGLAIYAPQLAFFWTIFQGAAIGLWCVLAFWIGLFLVLSRQALLHFGQRGLLALPVLWLGLEYLRSEVYYLRFSWLTPGYAFSGSRLAEALGFLGVYGMGALFCVIAAGAWALPRKARAGVLAVAIASASFLGASQASPTPPGGSRVEVAGVQLEFPDEAEVLAALNHLSASQTNASLFVLSEYTFKDAIPESIRSWCRNHRKHLVVGGQDPVGEDYFNTAFVVGPDGNIAFKQGKCVPIQFFKDGLPAREQRLWNSPWGKVGFGVCYDLSYRRVIDELVAQGCQALIIPTMDVEAWGERQHRLHARVAPMRAAEFGVPVFRLCSSGISQAIHGGGLVTGTAPFPGQNAVLSAALSLGPAGRRPLDHWLGPAATGVCGLLLVFFAAQAIRLRPKKR